VDINDELYRVCVRDRDFVRKEDDIMWRPK
jgi:hypothetical protein